MPGKKGSESNPIFFKGPSEYRAWLEKNHESAEELWIGYWKKSTGKPSLTWQEAVDECLCFGWIDGIRKSVDEDRFKQRVTPRRAKSNWSKVNIGRVAALKAEGRMRPAGLAAFEKRDVTSTYSYEQRRGRPALGAAEEATFRKNRKAWEYFQSQAPYYRRMGGMYVMSAKKEETRERRLKKLISDSAAGGKIGVLEPAKKGDR